MKKIEIATLKHLNEFSALFDNYRVFYREARDLEKVTSFLSERIIKKETVTFLMLVKEKVIGFAQLYPLFHYGKLEKQWLLSDLFIHPDFRGQGLSVELIDRCKLYCEETGACGLQLETEKTNDIGNSLYPKCGFELEKMFNHYNWWK